MERQSSLVKLIKEFLLALYKNHFFVLLELLSLRQCLY